MRHSPTNALLVAATVLVSQLVGAAVERPNWRWLIVCAGPDADTERAALTTALRLLPRLPARVAVIDATEAKPDVQPTLLRLEAFILRGSAVVYVVRQGALLRGAVAGSTFHTLALAAVVWHEMAHAEGADEREAREREGALWTTFVRDQRVDQVTALRYMKALASRPDPTALALRLRPEQAQAPARARAVPE
jgi:hypothetical protein